MTETLQVAIRHLRRSRSRLWKEKTEERLLSGLPSFILLDNLETKRRRRQQCFHGSMTERRLAFFLDCSCLAAQVTSTYDDSNDGLPAHSWLKSQFPHPPFFERYFAFNLGHSVALQNTKTWAKSTCTDAYLTFVALTLNFILKRESEWEQLAS